MDMQQGDLDRIFFFEHARKTAEATYAKDPLDADVRFIFIYLFFFWIVCLVPGKLWEIDGIVFFFFFGIAYCNLVDYAELDKVGRSAIRVVSVSEHGWVKKDDSRCFIFIFFLITLFWILLVYETVASHKIFGTYRFYGWYMVMDSSLNELDLKATHVVVFCCS